MWKNREQEEYEASAPAVKAHFHALRAEEAWKKDEYPQAEREARLASEKFVEAANAISDKRTIDALLLLAENYEYRAHEARAKMPEPETAKPNIPATRTDPSTKMERLDISSVTGVEPMQASGFTPMSSGLEGLDPKETAGAENQLNQAAEEIEELWRRLLELGLSTSGNTDKNHVLMSSRHLSSSLGDSFCLLPTKARTPIGSTAVAIDGGSTLRAAVASRMRNQRVRLMEKQYGPRAAVDTRLPQAHAHATNGNHHHSQTTEPTDFHHNERSSSLTGRGGASDLHDADGLQETITHQKYEIVRLLNTVKTLSNENTTLLKKCDALSTVQEENKELQESMEKFKSHYNQKLVMIKRALEEWMRQQNQSQRTATAPSAATVDTTSSRQLEEQARQLQQQQQQIQQLTATVAKRDAQLAKYEQWYHKLKEGARAKRNQSESGGGLDTSGVMGPLPRDSFTDSNSLHEPNRGSIHTIDTMNGMGRGAAAAARDRAPIPFASGPSASSRPPPAHLNRRAL